MSGLVFELQAWGLTVGPLGLDNLVWSGRRPKNNQSQRPK